MSIASEQRAWARFVGILFLVIRYGHDGTATVELRALGEFVRRVLFLKGVAVASDATKPVACTWEVDTTTVGVGGDERYELPDAPLSGP